MKKIKVIIQNAEVEADLLNPEVTKQVEDGMTACFGRIAKAKELTKGSDGIKEQCQAVIDYATSIFGKDGAKEIFGEQTDLLTCMEVLEEMYEMYEKQVNPILKEKTEKLKQKLEGKSDA